MDDVMKLTFKQVLPLMKADLKQGQTPALMGEPGIGKTSLIRDLEKESKTKTFILPVNQLADRADLTGVRMTKTENGKWQQESFPHSIIMESIEYAETHPDEEPILFLDEFNRASSDITSAILSFQTLRKIGDIEFPDNLRLIVAGNAKGNVTALDSASITRFSVYHVIPDLETFMSVQEVNPFIKDVLMKHPGDLMAGEAVMRSDVDKDDEDNEDNSEDFELAGLEFMVEESFKQKTNPRTITYTSEWLNAMGIDKTGSDAEKEVLGGLFVDMTNDDSQNVLLAGIVAHVGSTTFAFNLFEEIRTHFNTIINAGSASNVPVLDSIRPKQEFINELSAAQDVQAIEELLAKTDKVKIADAIVWLTEARNVKEINNNKIVTTFMSLAPHNIDEFDGKTVKNLMTILTQDTLVSDLAINALLTSSGEVMKTWKPVIKQARQ